MTSRERAKLIDHLHKLADEALAQAVQHSRQPALASKQRGRAEAFRLAADLIEQGTFHEAT